MYSELQLWQVPKSTQDNQEEGEEGAQSSPETFHLAQPRIKDWKSGPKDSGWGHERRGSAVIGSKDQDTAAWKWHYGNGIYKAMQCCHWICDDVSARNMWWQLIGVLFRSCILARRKTILFPHKQWYSIWFKKQVSQSVIWNFKSVDQIWNESQSSGCCGTWNALCFWWLSQIAVD